MFGIGLEEIALLVLFLLIFFGANRLPDIGRSLGDAMRDREKDRTGTAEPRPSEEEEPLR